MERLEIKDWFSSPTRKAVIYNDSEEFFRKGLVDEIALKRFLPLIEMTWFLNIESKPDCSGYRPRA